MADNIMLFHSSLPPVSHASMRHYLRLRKLGDNATHEQVPILVLTDPEVWRHVRGMLGPDVEPDPCRHVHTNPSPILGDWHVDDYCGQPWPEGWQFAILCYFPQDTPVELGPTVARINGQEVIADGPAGTCLLMRHDVEHRSTGNTTGGERFMLKYLFRAPASEES